MKYLRLSCLYLIASLLALAPQSHADVTYEVLTDWSTGPDLRNYKNKLVEGADGDFYGTSAAGGAHGHGCVFKMSSTGDITILASFTGVAGDLPGAEPQGRLLLASDGNFYGTTKTGGAGNFGTIFQMLPDGTATSLAEFAATDGRHPLAGLAEGDNEEFFGTTSSGGTFDAGTVFKISTSGVIDVLFSTAVKLETGLTLGSDGNFYTISKTGGTNSDGAILKITQAGSGSIFASFNFGSFVHTYGANSELVEDADGNFYGTTQDGGAFDTGGKTGGTIYKVTPGGVISTLVEFTGNGVANKGAWPTGGLTLGADGLLYGTTLYGGSGTGDGAGTVFKVTTTGTLTTLAQLSTTSSSLPDGGVIEGTDGNFYGIAANSIYSLTPTNVFTELADTDRKLGQNPKAGLVEGTAGEFYGITSAGGYAGDHGTIFKLTSAGVYTELGQFDGNPFSGGIEGALPFAGLIKGADGNFYGTTFEGGANNFGTVFKLSFPGDVPTITTLAEFTGDTGAKKGAYPHAALCQDTNGDLYGTTTEGGANGMGTIFKVTTDGVTFSTVLEFNGNNGSFPDAALVKSTGGFYGTTRTGGTSDLGTAFVVTSGGSLTTLHHFNGTTGSLPSSSLVEVSPGEFYGTTSQGGADDFGTIFKVTAMGVQSTLVEFNGSVGTNAGAVPLAGLIKDASNNLYGTTSEGGADDLGTIFKVTTTGTLTTLFEFTGDTGDVLGGRPSYAPLLMAADGMLYGTTSESGDHGGGTLFRVNLTADPVIPPVVTTGAATAISDTIATLGGSVDPNDTATSYYFEYGEDDSYGQTTTTQSAGDGTATVNVTANITGLTPGTTYHFRLVATNVGGTFEGLDATFTTRTFGISEVIAKGDLAPDDTGATFGATFLGFSPPAMNDVERFAFMGKMTIGLGGVTKANDTGIWAHNGSDDLMLIAREGSEADDTTGVFASFGNPIFANNDHVAFLAKLKPGVGGVTAANATGIWSNASGTLSLIARQGQQVDTLDIGVAFSQFIALALPNTGGVVFLAKIKGPGIKGTNDMGIWAADEFNALTLVAREGDPVSLTGGDKTISTIQFLPTVKIVGGQARSFNNDGNLTFRVVFTDKTQGVLCYSGGSLEVIAITGDDAGDVTDAKFKTFSQPAIDGSGNPGFLATMQVGLGNVTNANDTGIWQEAGALTLIAREGSPAEDTTGVFASFSDPVIRDNSDVAFYAKLKPGIGGVKASDAAGIWSNISGSLALIARQGQQADDVETGALYSAFTSLALPDAGGPVFLAKLKSKKNNVGIWATDSIGEVHLVVRTGDTLTINGGPKIVKTLEFLPSVLGVSGQTRSFNTASDLTFRAVFTDKTEAVLKVSR